MISNGSNTFTGTNRGSTAPPAFISPTELAFELATRANGRERSWEREGMALEEAGWGRRGTGVVGMRR
jgi:hypothetical protein